MFILTKIIVSSAILKNKYAYGEQQIPNAVILVQNSTLEMTLYGRNATLGSKLYCIESSICNIYKKTVFYSRFPTNKKKKK